MLSLNYMLQFFRQIKNNIRELTLCSTLFYAITAGFLGLMLLVTFSLGSSYRTLMVVEELVGGIVGSSDKKMELIHRMNHAAQERVIKLHQMVSEPNVVEHDKMKGEYEALVQQFASDRQLLEMQAASEDELKIMVELKSALSDLYPVQAKMLDALSRGQNEVVIASMVELEKKQNVLRYVLARYSMLEENVRHNSSVEIKNVFDESAQWMGFLSVFIIVAGGLVSILVVRFVTRQQRKLFDMNLRLESYNQVLYLSAKEAELANKVKLEFIDNLSHELRTPLTTIKGSLGILNSGMINDVPSEAQNLISMADQNTDQLIELMNDVLDFSRLDVNEIEVVKKTFNIHNEIEKFLIPFYQKARHKELNFNVVFSDQLPISVKLDQTYLFKILTQLIGNAIKFTHEGDVLLKVEYKEDIDSIVFHIIDTGIGFDEKDVHALFDSFVQGDGSSTRQYGGTGIGLAICKKLSDALKGEITVSSDKEKGSTFSLSVPVDIAA